VIQGCFRDDAPRATLTLVSGAARSDIEFVVDTGFTGMLALPSSLLSAVGATLEGIRLVQLTDGTQRHAPFYSVQIEWNGTLRTTRATLMEDEPLIGIGLLREHHLHVEVTEGGNVLAEPLQGP
jgi:clan AA aspartic protease